MKYQISVLVPGIRTNNWYALYKTILKAYHGSFEIIFVGPTPPPADFELLSNVKYIRDYGTPIRAQQIALVHSEGDWITWAADDGGYYPRALDTAWYKLTEFDMNYKTLVMGKYIEGTANPDGMRDTSYYILSNHDASRSRWLNKDYLMLNVGLVSRQLLMEVGGWDCQFEVCPMSYNDLACRLQNHKVKFIVQDEMMFWCTHMPGHEGDHGPVHDAQILNDQPLYQSIYSQKGCEERVFIPLDNWKSSPEKWHRRFGV